ncbi:type I restriction enzyme endonuclease domain-containing protein [Microbacterium sp.]|uniref:type I restriction enzyme endonuclease domain-containing protein n=1 Tax=Microbacterium sp. TaxID=51671 RepID=UPI0034581CF4
MKPSGSRTPRTPSPNRSGGARCGATRSPPVPASATAGTNCSSVRLCSTHCAVSTRACRPPTCSRRSSGSPHRPRRIRSPRTSASTTTSPAVKRLLVKYKYPPDRQPEVIGLVMDQMGAMAPRYATERA